MDRRLEEHGMRRPTLEEATVAMVMVSHRFADFLTPGYLDSDLPVCALVKNSEKQLEMREMLSRLVLEIDDITGGLCSNYCYVCVLVEEEKS